MNSRALLFIGVIGLVFLKFSFSYAGNNQFDTSGAVFDSNGNVDLEKSNFQGSANDTVQPTSNQESASSSPTDIDLDSDQVETQIMANCPQANTNPNFKAFLNKCLQNHKDTVQKYCNEKRNEIWLKANSSVEVLNRMGQAIGGAKESVLRACENMSKILVASGAGLTGFYSACSFNKWQCESSCDQAIQIAGRLCVNPIGAGSVFSGNEQHKLRKGQNNVAQYAIQQIKSDCTKKETNLAHIMTGIIQTASSFMSMKQCKDALAELKSGKQAYCQQNPKAIGCEQVKFDCTQPEYANSSTCICQANPRDPICQSLSSSIASSNGNNFNPNLLGGPAIGSSGGGASGDSSGLTTSSLSGIADGFGDLGGDPNAGGGSGEAGVVAASEKGKGGANLSGGGAGGGGGGGYGSQSGGYGGPSGGGGGYFGGAGGGGGSAGSVSLGSTYPGGSPQGSNPNKDQNKNDVNLKGFLPKGQYDPSRALAGLSGPDGITGPNTDIFGKIKIRYQAVTPTMKAP